MIGQILDYTKELASWNYEDLQREVSRALKRKGNVPFELVRGQAPGVDEARSASPVTPGWCGVGDPVDGESLPRRGKGADSLSHGEKMTKYDENAKTDPVDGAGRSAVHRANDERDTTPTGTKPEPRASSRMGEMVSGRGKPTPRHGTIDTHPSANMIWEMTDDEFACLKEDIRVNGLRDPIKLLDGLIIDGRNRQRPATS